MQGENEEHWSKFYFTFDSYLQYEVLDQDYGEPKLSRAESGRRRRRAFQALRSAPNSVDTTEPAAKAVKVHDDSGGGAAQVLPLEVWALIFSMMPLIPNAARLASTCKRYSKRMMSGLAGFDFVWVWF
jgi:hypothetical protein